MDARLAKYTELIDSFITWKISVEVFEKRYLELVKRECHIFDPNVADVIEKLFSDVDSYCDDPNIANYDETDPFGDIDEQEWRKRAAEALLKLIRK